MKASLRGLVLPALVLVAIEALVRADMVSGVLVPHPSRVVLQLVQDFMEQEFWLDLVATLFRVAQGFGIALVIALPVGILMGRSSKAEKYAGLLVDFLRSLPATALIPAFLLLFGIGELNKVAMVAFVASLILVVQISEGLRNIPVESLEVARVFGLSRWERALIAARLGLPAFLAGVVVSINLALVVVIVVEMFVGGGTRLGLGRRIFEAQSAFRMTEMWASVLAVGLLGYSLALLTRRGSKWLAPWVDFERPGF